MRNDCADARPRKRKCASNRLAAIAASGQRLGLRLRLALRCLPTAPFGLRRFSRHESRLHGTRKLTKCKQDMGFFVSVRVGLQARFRATLHLPRPKVGTTRRRMAAAAAAGEGGQAHTSARRFKRRDSPAPKASGCPSAKREPRRDRKGPSRVADAARFVVARSAHIALTLHKQLVAPNGEVPLGVKPSCTYFQLRGFAITRQPNSRGSDAASRQSDMRPYAPCHTTALYS